MKQTPLVSVIMPVFNAGSSLERSLRSLLNQTLDNLEIVVVNDGSTDDSMDIVEQLAGETDRIVSVSLPQNQGGHEARLTGLKKASAPWIGFLDADDFARPAMFEAMFCAASEHDADIVVCGSYRVNQHRKPIAPKIRFNRDRKVSTEVFEKFCAFQFGTGSLCNKLYRREIIKPYASMQFPWRQSINEDLLLNIGCFYLSKSVYLMKDVLHEYVFNEQSVTSTIQNTKAYVETYRAYAIAVSLFAELGEVTLENIANMYRTQLGWGNYQIGNLTVIIAYQQQLDEATALIYKTRPLALGLLAARPPRLALPIRVRHAAVRFAHKYIPLFRG